MAASPLDQLHRRAKRFLRDLDAETSIEASDRLDLLHWLQYELARRAAPLEPDDGQQVSGSASPFRPVYL